MCVSVYVTCMYLAYPTHVSCLPHSCSSALQTAAAISELHRELRSCCDIMGVGLSNSTRGPGDTVAEVCVYACALPHMLAVKHNSWALHNRWCEYTTHTSRHSTFALSSPFRFYDPLYLIPMFLALAYVPVQDRLRDTVPFAVTAAAGGGSAAAVAPSAKSLGDVRRFLNRLLGLPLGMQVQLRLLLLLLLPLLDGSFPVQHFYLHSFLHFLSHMGCILTALPHAHMMYLS
jgi:hypothetical protein